MATTEKTKKSKKEQDSISAAKWDEMEREFVEVIQSMRFISKSLSDRDAENGIPTSVLLDMLATKLEDVVFGTEEEA